jgi:hypothetical protein
MRGARADPHQIAEPQGLPGEFDAGSLTLHVFCSPFPQGYASLIANGISQMANT